MFGAAAPSAVAAENPVINTSEFVFPHGIETTDADAVRSRENRAACCKT